MADDIDAAKLESFLQELSKRYLKPATLYLLGGSALILLGSTRRTLDVDYVGIDIPGRWTELQQLIAELATEMQLKIEAVPYGEMIPPLPDSAQRHILIGNYGQLEVFVIDPYAMALGKLDRGFPSDLEDVVFLIQRNFITVVQLEKMIRDVIPFAAQYDLNPNQMQANLAIVQKML